MKPQSIIQPHKPCPAPVCRAVAAEIRAQRKRLVDSGDMPGAAHDACRHMLIAAGELEDAADDIERRG